MKRKQYTRRRWRGENAKVLRIGNYLLVTGRNELGYGVDIWILDWYGGRHNDSGSNTYKGGRSGFATPQDALQWARAMVLTGAL